MRTIDINSDLGESFGNWRMGDDEAVIPEITSANVACGFHASDPVTMIRTVALCKQHGVEVGSHPGLPDLLGFGRRPIRITPDDCYAYVLYQTGALQAVLAAEGMTLHHLKPHGALLFDPARGRAAGRRVLRGGAGADAGAGRVLAGGPELALPRAARERGIRVVMEVYVDMDYAPDGSIRDPAREARDRPRQGVAPRSGASSSRASCWRPTAACFPLEAESICVHGDGPNALEVIRALRRTIAGLRPRRRAARRRRIRALMRFGLMFSHQVPPGRGIGRHQPYADMLRCLPRAEELGYESVFQVSHHVQPDGLCPSPLIAMAAAAAVTERMRIATGCLLVPLYAPLKLAEDVAVLDCLSNGRFVFGVAPGYVSEEFAAHGCRARSARRASGRRST